MGEYVDSFGLTRYVGRGEGVDNLYDASAKPAEGACNYIEIKIKGEGIVPNVGTAYDRAQAYIPKGAVVGRAILFVEENGSADDVTLSLVKKDGSAFDPALTMLTATDCADNTAYNANGTNGKQVPEDAYVKMGGTFTGLTGSLKIEYV